jgi:uncharacterized membrane protein SpoIIM required for sporulation
MKQAQFEAENAALWDDIATIVDQRNDRQALPAKYRRLCQCLALAQQRGYSPALTRYLHDLVARCHRQLYGASAERPRVLVRWIARDLPRCVRSEWRLLLLVLVAFWGSALAAALLVWDDPHRALMFTSADQLRDMHRMYLSSKGRGGSEGDVMMFGHYIWNNISIVFRTFASGIFGGVLSLFSVVFNGINLGVIGCWLSLDPATRIRFWSFVITHSSFEMTGLLLAGLAGLRLGLAVLQPGRMSRRHALHVASEKMFPIVAGAALLTLLAAFVEGFWSARTDIAPAVKFSVGAACWSAVILYFALVGRGQR